MGADVAFLQKLPISGTRITASVPHGTQPNVLRNLVVILVRHRVQLFQIRIDLRLRNILHRLLLDLRLRRQRTHKVLNRCEVLEDPRISPTLKGTAPIMFLNRRVVIPSVELIPVRW